MKNQYHFTGFADEIAESLTEQLAFLNRLGISNMEIRGIDGRNVSELTVEEAKEVKKKLDAAGIKVSAIGSPIGKIGITEEFEPHFQLFKHVLKLAEVFDTANIRIFSFYMPEGEDPGHYREEVLERLGKMIRLAEESGKVLLHENEKGIYGDVAVRCKTLMEELYSEHFGAIFDFANFVQCGQDTEEAYEMLKVYIKYIHVKDALGSEVVPPGHGDGKLLQIFRRLYAQGYNGFLSLEPHLADFTGFAKLEQVERHRAAQQEENTASAADRHSNQGAEKLFNSKFTWWIALNGLKSLLFDLEAEADDETI